MQQNSIAIGHDIYHLASPITIEKEETIVNLEDYFLDISKIIGVSISEGFHVDASSDFKYATISVLDPDFKPISSLKVKTITAEYDIILLKSRKVRCNIRYNPWGATLKSVQIAGSLNSWNPAEHYFQLKNGIWEIEIDLEPGIYQYQLIADGKWFCDPDNPHKADNGYGAQNSILTVRSPYEDLDAVIFTEKTHDQSIVVQSDKPVDEYVVLWQNQLIEGQNIFQTNVKLMLTIPPMSHQVKRSYIRVWAYNKGGYTNDLLIPLDNGKIVLDASQLNRNDKEAQIIYFLMVDRFNNGNPENDQPFDDTDLHAKLNYNGGDLVGITQKIKEGYFEKLGVNSLWISPVVQNPTHCCTIHGRKSTGYHGYWPTICTRIDARFGTPKEFTEMVTLAHKGDMNVILDYVANHVHEDNDIYKTNPEWATPLILPDGSKNIGRWEDQRYTTWFDEFLPTLDYFNPEVVETMTEFALLWASTYDLDGFRHDACKHIPEVFWRTLTQKLKHYIMVKENKRLYQIGETFGGRELLKSYVNSGIHDGQFSFNLYYEARSAFALQDYSFEKLSIALEQDIAAFGGHHLMGNISGNHDLPRFISYAGEDLGFSQNAEHEGWVRYISVKNPVGYKRLQCLMAFNCTIPGVPVIYYGDEIGMAGGADPDNRRPMKFFGLNDYEQENFKVTARIVKLRRSLISLIFGEFKTLLADRKSFVYQRNYFEEATVVFFNKANEDQEVYVDLQTRVAQRTFYNNFGNEFSISGNTMKVHLKPWSFEILSTKKIS